MLKLNYGCFLSTNWCYMLLLNIPLISDKTLPQVESFIKKIKIENLLVLK